MSPVWRSDFARIAATPRRETMPYPETAAAYDGTPGEPVQNRRAPASRRSGPESNANGCSCAIQPVNAGSSVARTRGLA